MIARALAEAGAARVYIVGRRTDVLQSAAASINKPTVVVPLYCDVTSKISLESVVSVIENDAGFLNLVVCNAGVGGPQVPFPQPGTSIEEWQAKNLAFDFGEYTDTFKVNVSSVWFTAMSCLKLLDAGNKRGNLGYTSQVVVTSSIAAFNKKAPGGWAYSQSKAAATHLAKNLSVVLPTWNIRWVDPLSTGGFYDGDAFANMECLVGQTVSVQDVSCPLFFGLD
jgi:NAD(P)-dependent dehydrogenase (short-subunit alcohol dehydrogenase family)